MEPYKVRKRLRFFLYNIGFLKLKDDKSKCDFLSTISINPYDVNLINKPITTVDGINLLQFVEIINYFTDYDIFNTLIDTENVNHSVTETTLGLWCSDSYNMKIEDVDEILCRYFTYSKKLFEIEDILRSNVANGTYFFNLKKIQPYIINIRRLNDKLLQLL